MPQHNGMAGMAALSLFGLDLPPWVAVLLYIIVPGGGVALLSTFVWRVVSFFRKRLYFSVSVRPNSQIEQWLEYWLAENQDLQSQAWKAWLTESSTVDPSKKNKPMRGPSAGQDLNDTDGAPEILLLPMENENYRLTFQGKWVWVSKTRTSTIQANDYEEYMTLTVFSRNDKLIKDLVEHARLNFNAKLKEKTVIWSTGSSGWRGSWRALDPRPSRPMKTVLLQGDVAERVTSDVKEFLDNADWYYRRGIPYRRGYLLYGPPGCGKTSFMTALAGELNLVICIVNLSSSTLNDDKLLSLFSEAPRGSILLLEDVDSAFRDKDKEKDEDDEADIHPMIRGRNARKSKGSEGITFSGLLNAIDGVAAQEGKVLFMTTNHIDELDEALIRPGRVDVRVKFDLAASDTAGKLFLKFYELNETEQAHALKTLSTYPDQNELENLSQEFAKEIPEGEYSMALIQGHLMDFRKFPRQAVQEIDSLHRNVKAIATAALRKKQQKDVTKLDGDGEAPEMPQQLVRSRSDEIIPGGSKVLKQGPSSTIAESNVLKQGPTATPAGGVIRRRRDKKSKKPAPPSG